MPKNLNEETFVCIDCETTGLDPKTDRIIEVAIASFSFDQIFNTFESLINPHCEIPETSVAIHKITPEMVAGKPSIDTIIPDILKIAGRHTIIGHGIGFDVEILASSAERAGIQCTLRQNNQVDTLRMARLYGESPVNSLEQLRRHFNIPQEGAHRAMNDVVVNIEVFKYLVHRFKTLDQIFDVLAKPIMLKIMPLGKHKGRPMKEVPIEYLQWAANKDFDQDLLYSLRSEIKKRKKGNLFAQSANPFQSL